MRIIFLYGVDEHGRRVLSKRVSRAKLAMVAKLPSCDWHGGVFDVASLG